jgi:hypothetical protein
MVFHNPTNIGVHEFSRANADIFYQLKIRALDIKCNKMLFNFFKVNESLEWNSEGVNFLTWVIKDSLIY